MKEMLFLAVLGNKKKKSSKTADKVLPAEKIALENEKQEQVEKLNKAFSRRLSEGDGFLKKEISKFADDITKAINDIEKYSHILTTEYETLLNLSEDKLNLIKSVIKTDNDIAYELERFSAKVKELQNLAKSSKINLQDEINQLAELYNEYEHKAGGLHVATLLKLSQLEKMRKEMAAQEEKTAQQEDSDTILDIAQDLGNLPEYSSENEKLPKDFLENKIAHIEKSSNKGIKGFFKKIFSKEEPIDIGEGIKEELSIPVDENTETLADFFEHQKNLLEEKTKTKYSELQMDSKRRKEDEIGNEHKFKPISTEIAEIKKAVREVKKGAQKNDSLISNIPKSGAIDKDVSVIYQKIAQAKEAITVMNLEKAKKIYMEIMKLYNKLSHSSKHLVYKPIHEIYTERKSAEKNMIGIEIKI